MRLKDVFVLQRYEEIKLPSTGKEMLSMYVIKCWHRDAGRL